MTPPTTSPTASGPAVGAPDGSYPATAMTVAHPGADWVEQAVLVPPPVADEVLVDVEAVGLCHADLAARDGAFPVPMPAVLGHEGVGVVRAVGPGAHRVRVGDRVVLTFDACSRCRDCTAGRPTRCEHYMELNFGAGTDVQVAPGRDVDGRRVHGPRGPLFSSFFGQSSMASTTTARERNAVVVPPTLPAHLLAPLGCAVQTGAGAVLGVARPGPGDVVVVVGMGPVGFSALAAAVGFTGAEHVVAVDRHPARLELALRLGATATIDTSRPAGLAALSTSRADVVVECSGAPAVLAPALAGLRNGGTAVVVGAPPFGTTVDLDVAAVVNRSITIRGTVEGDSRPHEIIPWLAAMVETGRWPLEALVSTYRLDQVGRAAHDMAAGLTVKPVLLVGDHDQHPARPNGPRTTTPPRRGRS